MARLAHTIPKITQRATYALSLSFFMFSPSRQKAEKASQVLGKAPSLPSFKSLNPSINLGQGNI